MQVIEEIITSHPFFKEFEPHDIKLMAECASEVKFRAGQFIFREGEEANAFYVIRKGKVTVETFAPGRGPVVLQTIAPSPAHGKTTAGDVLGWSWLFQPYQWVFDGRALENTEAIAFDAKLLRERCAEDHDLGYVLLRQFAHIVMDRLQATRMQLLELKFD